MTETIKLLWTGYTEWQGINMEFIAGIILGFAVGFVFASLLYYEMSKE